ncbi:MAG: hypothetical protein KDH96_07375 [Candidatus Riesia sp.]|nr:hypothetical protein [Candidatus Riesia sp.]
MDISLRANIHSEEHGEIANKFSMNSKYPGYRGTVSPNSFKGILISNWDYTEPLRLYYSSQLDMAYNDTLCSLNIFKYLL